MNRSLKQYLKKPSSNKRKIAPFKPNQNVQPYPKPTERTKIQMKNEIQPKEKPTERTNIQMKNWIQPKEKTNWKNQDPSEKLKLSERKAKN